MKLLIAGLGVVCALALAQDRSELEQQAIRINNRLMQVRAMSEAISRHQPFQLPELSLGPKASVTATAFISDDGYVLTLTGVEIRTDSLIVQADELHLHWDTGEIEPVGNVRVRPIRAQ